MDIEDDEAVIPTRLRAYLFSAQLFAMLLSRRNEIHVRVGEDGIPSGARCVGIYADPLRSRTIAIVVTHPDFDEVPENSPVPEHAVTITDLRP